MDETPWTDHWHNEGVQVGVFRAHSCLRCGALCVVGSAMKQHDEWHRKQAENG